MLERLRSAAHELEQELSNQTSEQEALRRELELAQGAARRHLERLAALEVELQTLKRAPLPSPELAALQEEQDAFLTLLLDDHEQELMALRRERDDALAELALRDHRARRGEAASAELERLRVELNQAHTRTREAEQARDAALRATARTEEELGRLRAELAVRPQAQAPMRAHPSPPPELLGALTHNAGARGAPQPREPDRSAARLGARAPLKPNRADLQTARDRPTARPEPEGPVNKADLRTTPLGRATPLARTPIGRATPLGHATSKEEVSPDNRRTAPARPRPVEEDQHLCGPDGDRLVPVEDDEPSLPQLSATVRPTDNSVTSAAQSNEAQSNEAQSNEAQSREAPAVSPTQPSLRLPDTAHRAPRAEPQVEVQAPRTAGSPGSYSMPEDAAAPVEVVPARRKP